MCGKFTLVDLIIICILTKIEYCRSYNHFAYLLCLRAVQFNTRSLARNVFFFNGIYIACKCIIIMCFQFGSNTLFHNCVRTIALFCNFNINVKYLHPRHAIIFRHMALVQTMLMDCLLIKMYKSEIHIIINYS